MRRHPRADRVTALLLRNCRHRGCHYALVVIARPLGDDGPEAFTRDRLTFLTYGMVVVFGFTVAAIGPAMPLLREDLAISRTVGGLHFTALSSVKPFF